MEKLVTIITDSFSNNVANVVGSIFNPIVKSLYELEEHCLDYKYCKLIVSFLLHNLINRIYNSIIYFYNSVSYVVTVMYIILAYMCTTIYNFILHLLNLVLWPVYKSYVIWRSIVTTILPTVNSSSPAVHNTIISTLGIKSIPANCYLYKISLTTVTKNLEYVFTRVVIPTTGFIYPITYVEPQLTPIAYLLDVVLERLSPSTKIMICSIEPQPVNKFQMAFDLLKRIAQFKDPIVSYKLNTIVRCVQSKSGKNDSIALIFNSVLLLIAYFTLYELYRLILSYKNKQQALMIEQEHMGANENEMEADGIDPTEKTTQAEPSAAEPSQEKSTQQANQDQTTLDQATLDQATQDQVTQDKTTQSEATQDQASHLGDNQGEASQGKASEGQDTKEQTIEKQITQESPSVEQELTQQSNENYSEEQRSYVPIFDLSLLEEEVKMEEEIRQRIEEEQVQEEYSVDALLEESYKEIRLAEEAASVWLKSKPSPEIKFPQEFQEQQNHLLPSSSDNLEGRQETSHDPLIQDSLSPSQSYPSQHYYIEECQAPYDDPTSTIGLAQSAQDPLARDIHVPDQNSTFFTLDPECSGSLERIQFNQFVEERQNILPTQHREPKRVLDEVIYTHYISDTDSVD